jgi:hypothetical protein
VVDVTINGPGIITGSFVKDGTTYYGWTFNVTVDGQYGVYTVWLDTNDPADEPDAAADAVNDLEADPGDLGGIAQSDSGNGTDGTAVTDGPGGDSGGDTGGDTGGDSGGDGGTVAGGGVLGDSV